MIIRRIKQYFKSKFFLNSNGKVFFYLVFLSTPICRRHGEEFESVEDRACYRKTDES